MLLAWLLAEPRYQKARSGPTHRRGARFARLDGRLPQPLALRLAEAFPPSTASPPSAEYTLLESTPGTARLYAGGVRSRNCSAAARPMAPARRPDRPEPRAAPRPLARLARRHRRLCTDTPREHATLRRALLSRRPNRRQCRLHRRPLRVEGRCPRLAGPGAQLLDQPADPHVVRQSPTTAAQRTRPPITLEPAALATLQAAFPPRRRTRASRPLRR